MSTLLGSGYIPLSEEQRKAKEEAYDKARLIAWEVWYQAFECGSISLDDLLRNAQRSLIKLGVEDYLRWKTLGLLAERALKSDPPKRSRGNKGQPESLRNIARQLVDLANNDGFVLSRLSPSNTAFEHVAEMLANLGISVTPRQAEDWYYPSSGQLPE